MPLTSWSASSRSRSGAVQAARVACTGTFVLNPRARTGAPVDLLRRYGRPGRQRDRVRDGARPSPFRAGWTTSPTLRPGPEHPRYRGDARPAGGGRLYGRDGHAHHSPPSPSSTRPCGRHLRGRPRRGACTRFFRRADRRTYGGRRRPPCPRRASEPPAGYAPSRRGGSPPRAVQAPGPARGWSRITTGRFTGHSPQGESHT